MVINPAYKKETAYREQRRVEKIKSEKRIQDEEKKLIEKQTAAEEARIELANKKAETSKKDPTTAWRDQYNREFIINSEDVSSLDSLLNRVYKYGGRIESHNLRGERTSGMSPDELLRVDILGLATIEDDNKSVRLTDKGKYFTKLYKMSQNKDLSNE